MSGSVRGWEAARKLPVFDGPDLLHLELAAAVAFHGRFNIGGVALGWRVLEFVWERWNLFAAPPERAGWTVFVPAESVHTGVYDAFEFALRLSRTGGLHLAAWDAERWPGEECPVGPGRFFFGLTYGRRRIGVALRQGAFSSAFKAQVLKCRDARADDDERALLRRYKEDLAETVLARGLDELFTVHDF